MVSCSPDIQWLIIRDNSSFLVKNNNMVFTKEPNNLKNKNSFRYNGLIHRKTVGIEPAEDGKGVVLVTKKQNAKRNPGKWHRRVTMKRDARRNLTSVRNEIVKGKYRTDLKKAALRRVSAILRSQKPVTTIKKKKSRAKRE
ncbi:large ribosomal subunit protein eL28-like [Ptychodera flava]|uniref:large ribosomal subunit protein eL28-like n=1 Tax=Ptychodera flava TaxID=63121 RepID=UPI00396A27A4